MIEGKIEMPRFRMPMTYGDAEAGSRQSTFDSVSSLWAVPWPWVSFAQLMIPSWSRLSLLFVKFTFRFGGTDALMIEGKIEMPRFRMPMTVYIRFGLFFMGGALAVGIVCAANDPQLESVVTVCQVHVSFWWY
jgi:amino acid permease